MSKKFVFKKSYSNFYPALHWNIILFSTVGVFLLSLGYATYLYLYTRTEINAPLVAIEVATSSLPFESLKSVKNIEQVVDVYKKRAETYNEIMYGLRMGEVPLVDIEIPVLAATTSIATTTK